LSDYFATFGIRLWLPDRKIWVEISSSGKGYLVPRSSNSSTDIISPSVEASSSNVDEAATNSSYSNELLDGSIIDISGVVLLFQKSGSIVQAHKVDIDKQQILMYITF
jgi:hypothetical protein